MILNIILGAIALFFLVQYIRSKAKNLSQFDEFNAELAALELGNEQLQESYEAMILDEQDKVEAIENLAVSLQADVDDRDSIIDYHAKNCHSLVEDTIDLILERLRPTHQEEVEGVPADG